MRSVLYLIFISTVYMKLESYTCQSITVTGSPNVNLQFADTAGNNITSITLDTPTGIDIANNTGSSYTSSSKARLSLIFNGSSCTASVSGNNSYSSGIYNTYFKMLSGSYTLPLYVSQDKTTSLGTGPINLVQNSQCFALSAGQAGSVQCVEWSFVVPPSGLSDAIAGTYSLTLTVSASASA